MACLAKLIHTALQLEHCGMKTEILESHVPLDEAQKDDYHIERPGRLPETTMWAPESLREIGFGGLDEIDRIRLGSHKAWSSQLTSHAILQNSKA